MYSLIWQSVMWRPGKLRFLIGVKNPLPIRPTATARKHGPLRAPADRQIRDFSRATPSFRHASGDFLILIDVLFSSYSPRSINPFPLGAGSSGGAAWTHADNATA
jgi:hypothetical protein